MRLFLNNKWNFPSKSKIAPNSTNINRIEILTVLQDSFIYEEYNDMFNIRNNAAEAAENSFGFGGKINHTALAGVSLLNFLLLVYISKMILKLSSWRLFSHFLNSST